MSFITGFNLSDNIILAADSRVTYPDMSVYDDWLLKIEIFNSSLAAAYAGNVHFARYLLRDFYNCFAANKDILDVRRLFEDTRPKGYLNNLIGQYDRQVKETCFIFGGTSRKTSKVIDGKNFLDVTKFHTKNGQGRSLPPVIASALFSLPKGEKNAEKIDLKIPYSTVFGLTISPNGYTITEAEYGKVIMYGPKNIRKENVNDEISGLTEFSGMPKHFIAAPINGLFESEKQSHNLQTVGGYVSKVIITEEGASIITSPDELIFGDRYKSQLINRTLYVNKNNSVDIVFNTLRKYQLRKDISDLAF